MDTSSAARTAITAAERYPGLAEHYRGREVFLTGATGFVGGHIAARLLDYGSKLRVLVRASSNSTKVEELTKRGATIVTGDLTEAESLKKGVAGADIVFHIGALYREAKFADEVYHQVNFGGTKLLLDAACTAGTKRFIYCSTTGVHSHIENPPGDEESPFHPTDVYQVSKAEAEKLVRSYFKEGKIEGSVIRPAMIWGEGDTRFLKMFRGIAKRSMPLIGNGNTWTHWIYIEDLVDAFLLAGMRDAANGQVYIIAGEKPIPLKEVYKTIAALAGTKPLPFNIPVKPLQWLGLIVEKICRPFNIEPPIYKRRVDFFIKNRSFKIAKAQAQLGYKPHYSFEEEASRIYEWYRSAGWL